MIISFISNNVGLFLLLVALLFVFAFLLLDILLIATTSPKEKYLSDEEQVKYLSNRFKSKKEVVGG